MIKIQGKGTACKPDQYIISSNKISIYLLSLKKLSILDLKQFKVLHLMISSGN